MEKQAMKKELVVLWQSLANHTLPECRSSCRTPLSCCSPEYCGMTIEYAKKEWDTELEHTGHPTLPLMGPAGCTAPPHLRPWCTKHVCSIYGFGVKPGDAEWTERYFELVNRIDEAEYRLRDGMEEIQDAS